jgi:hypothetical protein
MATYKGHRSANGTLVTVDDEPLDPRLDLRNLAMVFEWGYAGSGPYQLAIALLAHHRGDEDALKLYKDFAEACIAEIADDDWTLDSADIEKAIENATPVPMDLNELLRRVRGG